MPNESPILSICIATMNRGNQLERTLEALLQQIDEHCEIVVVDGASTDDTESIATRLAHQHPEVRYFREPINSGVDADYDRAVAYANGKYCWLLTDDDRLLAHAVPRILGVLAGQPALLVVNARVEDAASGQLLVERRLPFEGDRTYLPAEFDRFFVDCIRYLSYIGAVVIRRELWLARQRERYFGTAFIHIGVIFQAPLTGPVVAMAEPVLCLRYGEAGWRSRAFDIWVIRWPMLLWSFDGLSPAARRAISPPQPWGDLRYLLLHRALDNYGPREFDRFVAARLAPGWRKALAWCAARAPRRPLNFAAWCYASLFNTSATMLRSDLESASCYWRRRETPR